MTPLIVGLSGKKRCGKDTACTILKNLAWEQSIAAERFAFADAVKSELARAFGVPLELVEEAKEFFRPALQWWGQGRRVMNSPNHWINRTDALLRHTSARVAILTDIRYQNEADYARDLGGILVRIVRRKTESEDAHPSEMDLDGYEFAHTIFNDDLEEFKSSLELLWRTILRPALNEREASLIERP